MSFDVVRAWKDEEYRNSLSAEELAMLPECPAGEMELTDADLEQVSGGCHHHANQAISFGCVNSAALACLQSALIGACVSAGICNVD
ncbi:mersacidin/lichenicidin family type 2 lantibiotic [Thermosporothrix hazakensis]|uniref:Mersacidin/lichenicidin family type 2 lantibiotic n=2 Tax=Thermosporothrix TaxID=768650 RepID=A0A326UQ48_THEHA|nr:mersacidin/lichenicidin family type 2 lantibiotic [Thermosporothrix hazakensis]PZW36239.1 mersacidin/lichenicidin family type 2 lantibiotic [Thermosporothrix hazakensis]BBH88702.1 hypothetical protein KTC_34530 [Thermosporothrix sp. COM3]GCE46888.1 hypothetical protein KTH_17570 [Thermosporothrix hazakensis]